MNELSFDIPDADERGVSPVIGVILMVAITVILAAVIASFVLGFGGSVQDNAQAGVTIDVNSTEENLTDVTLTSLGSDTNKVDCSITTYTNESGNGTTISNNMTAQVGGTFQCPSGANIVAYAGSDNETQTVVQTDIEA